MDSDSADAESEGEVDREMVKGLATRMLMFALTIMSTMVAACGCDGKHPDYDDVDHHRRSRR